MKLVGFKVVLLAVQSGKFVTFSLINEFHCKRSAKQRNNPTGTGTKIFQQMSITLTCT